MFVDFNTYNHIVFIQLNLGRPNSTSQLNEHDCDDFSRYLEDFPPGDFEDNSFSGRFEDF
jgi:hypothetical protein